MASPLMEPIYIHAYTTIYIVQVTTHAHHLASPPAPAGLGDQSFLLQVDPCYLRSVLQAMFFQVQTLTVLGQLGLGAICHTLNGKATIITSTLRHVIISSSTILNFAVCMIKSRSVTVTTVSIIIMFHTHRLSKSWF